MKMNKIIGILLAACFLMSVTVAAVSAGDNNRDNQGPMGKDGRDNNGPKGHDDKFVPIAKHNDKHFKKVCYTKIEWKKKLVGFKYIKVGQFKQYGHFKPKFIKKPIFRMVPVHVKVCKIVPVKYGYR